jgi:hypothetical protein
MGSGSGEPRYLQQVDTLADVYTQRSGDDLLVTSEEDAADGTISSGVKLEDWFSGANTIEWFVTADNTHFQLFA